MFFKSDTEFIVVSIIYWCIICIVVNLYYIDVELAYCICKNFVVMIKLCKKFFVKDIELYN